MNVNPKPSRRFAEYVRKIKCDDWVPAGTTGNDKALLRHVPTGETVAYCLHDGGNDWNGPRNFALAIQRLCGCRLIEPRGRKRSRKSADPLDPQTEASRRRHAEQWEARSEERESARLAEIARQKEIERAVADDRRRREIEELMR